MMQHPPAKTALIRTSRRRKAVRQTLRPAVAPAQSRPDDARPALPVATDDLALFDADDLRALRSGWAFVA